MELNKQELVSMHLCQSISPPSALQAAEELILVPKSWIELDTLIGFGQTQERIFLFSLFYGTLPVKFRTKEQ